MRVEACDVCRRILPIDELYKVGPVTEKVYNPNSHTDETTTIFSTVKAVEGKHLIGAITVCELHAREAIRRAEKKLFAEQGKDGEIYAQTKTDRAY